MNGSWLGRGRGGRLAIYGGCTVILIFFMLLYRAATSEMARLRELNELCTNQQEALANQLQVIYEYKVRLEKFLADEKSSNAAVKQELQQRASREKSLRDKDSVEAMQRLNSLQQSYKMLQTEHQDLQEEFKKLEKQKLDETSKTNATLSELRNQIKQAQEDKEKSMEHLKNKYIGLEDEKIKLESKYNELIKANGNTDSTLEHLHKKVFQLQRELEQAKNAKCSTFGSSIQSPQMAVNVEKSASPIPNIQKARPSQQQQQQQQSPPSVNQQQNVSTNATKVVVSVALPENHVKASYSTVSTAKMESPPSNVKSVPKIKLPIGVVPIPIIPKETKVETESEINKKTKDIRIKDSQLSDKDAAINNKALEKEKENSKNAAAGNVDMLAFGGKRSRKNILDKRVNGDWLQEVGEEPNQQERQPGFDDPAQQGDLGDDQYENGDYYQHPQKHPEEGEDEGEDEGDLLDYPNNLKPEKTD